ncbi:conserved hypothetical protein [Leishmania major strain Friedlin]|uniref:Amastin-like protein n=1 Tax=Leishmania major TaxID=5664 RepID=Q4QEX1_LEIMA|nr:conserved hypothetical protein [Leishmania major strain Friedlin]CAG9572083.1 hypothetical_protein_-_conserved [Leishmania major strain Friedlin]CAJ03542.1 conserved hypothetical protein [Leishmania major strain Friedlin]|eukprot:XP_001682127.1 conserved hypothetical protein [Leishmania major strain Friedlin]
MKCCRVFVFVLLMLFTACATCSILFPVFRKVVAGTDTTNTVYFWYRQSSTPAKETPDVEIVRTYSYHLQCLQGQVYYTVTAALSVAATAFIASSALLTACWINARYNDSLAVTSTFTSFISLACCGATLGLIVCTYMTTLCPGEKTQMLAAKEDGYQLAEGFYLLCVATGGTLLCFVVGFALCCSTLCCSEEGKDDDYE